MKKCFIFLLLSFFFPLSGYSQIITTIAGNGTAGFTGDGSLAVDAELSTPIGVAVDYSGNVYIADRDSNRIRKVNIGGVITTIAGNGTTGHGGDGGQATAASVNQPYAVAVDAAGNLYICEENDNIIRKVNSAGIISTIAGGPTGYAGEGNGGPATAATLAWPIDITFDKLGNLYITEAAGAMVRKVDTFGVITIVAGDGTSYHGADGIPATATSLDAPYGAAVDRSGNIYIAEDNGNRIRKVSTDGIITTIAGSGTAGCNGDGGQATAANLSTVDVVVDGDGNLFICDAEDSRIRKVNNSSIISTIAGGGTSGLGDGGSATDCDLNYPFKMALDASGNMYIADSHNNRVRRITSVAALVNSVNNTENSLKLYPNPSNGSFTLELLSNTNEEAHIIITNVAGEKVKELTANTNAPVDVTLDGPSGIYFMSAVTAGRVWTGEIALSR